MWFDADGALLPGLLPGLFRGITFHVPDASTTPGRRVAEQLFPGVDQPGYDDFGLYPNEIALDGIIIGDDYIAQGIALEAAFNTAGPATLVHPWLGPMTVICKEPGQVYYSDRALRLVRFSAVFTRIAAVSAGFALSLPGLTAAIGVVTAAAGALCLAANTRVLSSVRLKAAARSHRIVAAGVAGLGAPAGSARFVPRLKASIPVELSADPIAFDGMVAAIGARLSAIDRRPAVAPAAGAVRETPATSAAIVSVGRAIAAALLAAVPEAPSDIDAALIAAANARILAATASQAVHVDYDARDAALAYRGGMVDAIDGLMEAMGLAAAGLLQGEASTLRRALRALQSAVIVDVNETIGRLKAVDVFAPGRPVDAYLLAHHIAGDRPASVEAVYRDIVARNRPRHPAQTDGTRIEVLAR